MNDNKNNQIIISSKAQKRLREASVASLLRMTPFSRENSLLFNKNSRGENKFYKLFYYESSDSENKKKDIESKIFVNETHPILLYGYSGSGKTTFIHSFLKDEKIIKVHNFEDISDDGENCIKDKIIFDFVSKIKMTRCFEFFNQLYNFIEQHYDIVGSILDNNNSITKIIKSVRELLNGDRIIRDGTFKLVLIEMFSELNTRQILILDFLSELCFKKRILGRHKMYICYDNLDNIENVNCLINFLTDFSGFYLSAKNFMTHLNNGKNTLEELFVYIVALRETTFFTLASHNQEFYAWNNLKYDLSLTFEKNIIIQKRTDVLKKFNFLEPEQKQTLRAIEEFAQNKYLNKYFFDIFNQNYRYSINTIATIAKDNRESVKKYNKLCESHNKNYYMLANGIILKLLINLFQQGGILSESLKLLNLHDRNEYRQVSISRVILTFLSNHQADGCKFNMVLSAFSNVFTNAEICSTISLLYNMKNSRWCHLVTYKYDPGLTFEQQVEKYDNNSKNENDFSTITITPAGISFLKVISVSFEFYSTRLINNIKNSPHIFPLGLVANEYENGRFKFEVILNKVFESVEKCYSRLVRFDNEIMKKKGYDSFTQYCHSDYIFRKHDGAPSIAHKEKLIFNHIGYINSFRLFLLDQETNPLFKIKINTILVQYIEKYLKLGENDPNKSVSKEVYNSLRQQIDIIKGANFLDFTTKIETRDYFRNEYRD